MSLPDNRLSTDPMPADFLQPDYANPQNTLEDFERGGVALNDASLGLRVRYWKLFYEPPLVRIKTTDDTFVTTLFSQANVSHLSFTFDQNMRPAVVYMLADGHMRLRWYDAVVQQTVTTDFGTGRTPRLAMDDKRIAATEAGTSDMILAYIRDAGLYYRQQRDRFTVERQLASGIKPEEKLVQMGMSRGWRMQFEVR